MRAATLPNLLTLARIALIPAACLPLFADDPHARWWAFALFAALAATDWLDGHLARRLDLRSGFGAMMDPIADKILVAALTVALVASGDIAGWDVAAAIAILGREFLVSGLREYLGRGALPVTAAAKWKTAAQLAAIALFILAPAAGPAAAAAASAAWWLAAALALATAAGYLRTAARRLRAAEGAG